MTPQQKQAIDAVCQGQRLTEEGIGVIAGIHGPLTERQRKAVETAYHQDWKRSYPQAREWGGDYDTGVEYRRELAEKWNDEWLKLRRYGTRAEIEAFLQADRCFASGFKTNLSDKQVADMISRVEQTRGDLTHSSRELAKQLATTTKELEATKTKLETSEAMVRDLQQQIQDIQHRAEERRVARASEAYKTAGEEAYHADQASQEYRRLQEFKKDWYKYHTYEDFLRGFEVDGE